MEIRRLPALLVILALVVPCRLAGHSVPLSDAQQMETSRHILVAVVEKASPRWSGRLIVTDYALRVEDQLRGAAPDRLEITLPGGTIGAETHGTCLALPLEVGARYLLFLGDLDRPGLSPLVGGWPGAVREGAGFEAAVSAVRNLVSGGPGDLQALDSAVQDGLRQAREEFNLGDLAVPPIVFAPLPESSPFSPHDQEQMAYWNVYQPDLFRVGAPAVTWSFGNGVSEIAGFPDDAKMQAEFGQPWIGSTYSFTAYRITGGHIVEVDVALNPAQRWTLDEAAATHPSGPFSFRQAILADLGIAWGMRPSFSLSPKDRESVVTPNLPQYRFPRLFSDDTAAVRAAFGEAPIRDGLISAYSLVPFPLSPRRIPAVPSPAAVRRGGRFKVIGPIKLENTGTESLANPVVEVYLAPERFSLEGALLVKRLRVRATIARGGLRNVEVGRVTVPAALPPGLYFLAYRLRVTGDEYRDNDVAWSDFNVTLTVKAD
jgi:hypothetical protein